MQKSEKFPAERPYLKGEVIYIIKASICIRKGKQILCYDFEGKISFNC